MMTMLAAAGAPFESRTSAGTAASAIWPATTAATIVSAAIIAIPSAAAAAERPLKASTWIAAYPRGVTRESGRGSGAPERGCTGFAGEEDAVILCDGWRRRGFCSGSLDVFGLHAFVAFIVADGCGGAAHSRAPHLLPLRGARASQGRVSQELRSLPLLGRRETRFPLRSHESHRALSASSTAVVGRFVFFLFFRFFLIFFLKTAPPTSASAVTFACASSCLASMRLEEIIATSSSLREAFGASRFCVHQIRSGLRRSGSRVVSGRR